MLPNTYILSIVYIVISLDNISFFFLWWHLNLSGIGYHVLCFGIAISFKAFTKELVQQMQRQKVDQRLVGISERMNVQLLFFKLCFWNTTTKTSTTNDWNQHNKEIVDEESDCLKNNYMCIFERRFVSKSSLFCR